MMDANIVSALRTRRNQQQAAVDRLALRLDDERAKLAAYDTVLADAERSETPRASRSVRPSLAVDDLRGLEPADAIVRIAERDHGTLRYTAARRMLVDAGLVAEGRDGIEEMRALVTDHPRLERVIGEKGRYRLIVIDDDTIEPANVNRIFAAG